MWNWPGSWPIRLPEETGEMVGGSGRRRRTPPASTQFRLKLSGSAAAGGRRNRNRLDDEGLAGRIEGLDVRRVVQALTGIGFVLLAHTLIRDGAERVGERLLVELARGLEGL